MFADCGGNLLQLTLGDKGAYLYAVFGSPHAHEDDAARAAAAGLYLLALDGVTGAVTCRSESPTAGCEAARTGTTCGARSSASGTP